MTPEQQRIAIAEACGLVPVITIPFTPNKVRSGHNGDWFTPESAEEMRKTYPNAASPNIVPNYLRSLDAMHEAEKTLDTRQRDVFAGFLGQLTGGRQIDCGATRINVTTAIMFATAAQRAEAFLRAKELWK